MIRVNLDVYKFGRRYIVDIAGEVYEMDEEAAAPNGVNIHLGNVDKLDPLIFNGLQKVELKEAPSGVRDGIRKRLRELVQSR